MKAIVVGRHKLIGDEGLEVIRQENINFPATSEWCREIVHGLLQTALETDASLVFQMMPGQLAIACADIVNEDTRYQIGVIINKPGERLAGVKKEFNFVGNDMTELGNEAIQLVSFVNPRAKAVNDNGVVSVVVDPPLRFEFSHIEWF